MPTKEFNVRRVFGPPTGYEWWEYDYDNVEMRIWAYSVGNPELISDMGVFGWESGVD
jgi:DNA polymerase I-like protein with 3'-5' exonuclease and polymerase domains